MFTRATRVYLQSFSCMCPVSGDLCEIYQQCPLFCEFYYRNNRALNTTFAETPENELTCVKHSTVSDDMFLLPPGKILTKMLLHLQVTVNQTQIILY